jgi:hypothetical protein
VPDLRKITIVSGGQTGADRAALDFAIQHGIPHDGWCPKGRCAEDGPIAEIYRLTETPSRRYSQRTEWNVRDSDATIVFSIRPEPIGGTALTLAVARRLGKPCLHLSRETDSRDRSGLLMSAVDSQTIAEAAAKLVAFLDARDIERLNVAGPRASQEPKIADFVQHVLQASLDLNNHALGA